MTHFQVVLGVTAGGLALVFGLVPGLMDGLTEGVQNFANMLHFGASMPARYRTSGETGRRSPWLAGLGAVIVVLTIVAYLAG